MHISVIICTHNPRQDYLQRTLDALKAQTLPKEQWELLLVDNASKDPLASKWDLTWHPHARHVREDELGLTSARLRGIHESLGELLIFIDDDNVLEPLYLSRARSIQESHPHLGVFGAGLLEPEFEVVPPAEILPHVGMLALRKVISGTWSNNPHDASCLPWGAGLCATRKTANHYLKLLNQMCVSKFIDRSGGDLSSGGDDLFTWASVQTGHGFGVFPELRITHLISAGRLSRDYFFRLVEGHCFSHCIIDYLLTGKQTQSQTWIRKMRIRLNGFGLGGFTTGWQLAAGRGYSRAAQLIAEMSLTPLNFEPDCPFESDSRL